MAENELVVATFNTEWRKTTSKDAAIIKERLAEAEVVCLTEAYRDFFKGEGHLLEPPFLGEGEDDGRRKVLLWSRRPWTEPRIGEGWLPSHFLAGSTETSIGAVTFYGVVIPYRFSGVRYGKPKRKVWEMHRAFLEDLDQLIPGEPQRSLILGDFNQRFPAKYQPKAIGELSQQVLLSRFSLATGGLIPEIGEQAIDHICHSPDLTLTLVEGISNKSDAGRRISDHFGLQATYTAKSPNTVRDKNG